MKYNNHNQDDIPVVVHGRNIKRGQIYFADLTDGVGSEQSGTRPVLVVQNDLGNKYSQTVTIVPITSRDKRPYMPTHVKLKAGTGNLSKDSVLVTEQIRTVSTDRLLRYIGSVEDYALMKDIEYSIKVQLGLNN